MPTIFKKFEPIATALSPNTEQDDITIVRRLLMPWNWNRWLAGDGIEKLENEFRKYFNVKYAIGFSSGRTGLFAILKSLSNESSRPAARDPRPEIIIQAYTTIAIPSAIKEAGFKPVYVDIEEKTYNIDPKKIETKITPQTKALIIQHTFGIPAAIDEIAAICKKHNLFLIEDCAHSLGAEFNGQKVGTFGKAAFFSFGRDKIISAVSGGLVIASDESLAKKIRAFHASLPYPPIVWILQRLWHPLIFAIALPVYYFFNLGKFIIFLSQKLKIIAKAYAPDEKKGVFLQRHDYKLPNALAELVRHQFDKIEKFNGHRLKLVGIYINSLKNTADIVLPQFSPRTKPTPLYYTIQIPARDKIMKLADRNHIVLGDWFPGALGPKEIDSERFGYKKGDCPIAEKVGSRSLNLPTGIRTSEKETKKIIEVVENFLKERLLKN